MVKEKLLLGCFGNKEKEYKQYLKDIIIKNTDDETIFIEPFCGSAIISKTLHDEGKIKHFHINDIDHLRIEFYKNMKRKKKREELYNIETKIKEKGKEEYIKYVHRDKIKNDYWSYIIGNRIYSFRHGLFPTTKNIVVSPIGENWIKFLNTTIITNQDYKDVIEKYKYNENGFVYIDPPYFDSYNASYNKYTEKSTDEESNIIDNTQIYIDLLEYLKICRCKILFSINSNALTRYLYKDFIKRDYNRQYETTNINKIKETSKNKQNILIICNFDL